MKKWLRRFLIAAGVLAAVLGIGIAWLDWETRPQPPDSELPMLARVVLPERSVAAANLAFKERVRSWFQSGIDERRLVNKLKNMSFEINEDRNLAIFSQQVFPCLRGWVTHWDTTNSRRVKNVDANFRDDCP